MLADATPKSVVVGVDYDQRAVKITRDYFTASNLPYRAGNLAMWRDFEDRPLGQFDCVISFDTIEHLLHREIALLNIAENLSNDGILLLSTPCGHSRTRFNPEWEPHKIEYSHTDLYKLLRRFFRNVLHTGSGTLPNQKFWDNVINAGSRRYSNVMNPVVCTEPIRI